MLISLIHPSRSRPDKSFNNSKEWLAKAGEGVNVELIVSLDYNDPDWLSYGIKYNVEPQLGNGLNNLEIKSGLIIQRQNDCVVQAANHAAKAATGDILIYLSDDFKCPDNWGKLILEQFKDVTTPLLIKVDDGYQVFGKDVLTIPIMNRALYQKLGYFFHPEYRSMFVDQDLYHVANNMGAIRFCPQLVFPHEHYCNGKAKMDETYKRSNANWDSGKALYARRKAEGFPL